MTTGTCNQRGEGLRGEETVLGTEPLIWGIWCCLHGDRFRTESTLQVTQRVSDNCLVWGKNARSPSPRAWRPDFPGAAREAP